MRQQRRKKIGRVLESEKEKIKCVKINDVVYTLRYFCFIINLYKKIAMKNSDFIITATGWLMVDDLYLRLDERFLIAHFHCLRDTRIVFDCFARL